VGDDGTVLSSAIVAADGSYNNTVSARAATAVRAVGQDGELQVGRGAGEGEAFVVLVLVGVAVAANGSAFGVVVQGGDGGVVDVGVAVDSS